MQPHYFVAESFLKAKQQIIAYCENINKPFALTYDHKRHIVEVDRNLKTRHEHLE